MADPTTKAPELPETDRGSPAAGTMIPSARSRHRIVDWRPILLEAFFVVLGVVLALAANEWRQSLADRRGAATALESIREELETNRQSVLRALQYHLYLADTLGVIRRQAVASGDSTSVPSVRVFSQGFVHPAQLLSTAWDAAAATEAVRHMSHGDVLALARVYEQQRRYATQGEQIGALIYGELFARGTGGLIRNYANLSSIIAAFWFRECELLLGYDRALAELRESAAEVRDVPERCRRRPPR